MSKVDIDYVVPPPDEEEELLAKIVFGDSSDFQENLANFSADFLLGEKEDELDNMAADASADDDNTSDEDEEAEIEHVNDDQLFFVDDGENENNDDDSKMDIDEEEGSGIISSDQESSEDEDSDAWEDSDDERLNVSVMDNNRSKKLRNSYNDNVLSGKQYVRRLRAQFEKIYPKPQWVDDEDSDLEEHGDDMSDDENNDDREEVINADIHALSKILQSTYSYKDTTQSKLLPVKSLDILRLKDANMAHPAQSAIQSLSFHPTKPLLLTGGYDKTLRIYHIDGKHNHLVTSLHLKSTPIQTCTFYVTPQQISKKKQHLIQEQKIFTGGRRRYMHSWDLSSSIINSSNNSSIAKVEKLSRLYGHEATQRSFEKFKLAHYYNTKKHETHGIILLQGNNGWVNVLNATSGIWMMGCKIEGTIIDFCIDYKPLSNNTFRTILIATNTYGEIWEFDLTNNGSVLRRWKDESGVGVTCIQVGGGSNSAHLNGSGLSHQTVASNRWLAIGSSSGFVNIYERRNSDDPEVIPTLVGTMDQLTTSISFLQFSPDGQILCMASRAVKDALRLVHLPSCTVFSNWPTSGTPLGKVTSATFSPRGEMLAVGTEQGKVRLWRLNHY
ncbi:similar to Saccharomyces cerevisiae YJL069C UTP18 Possible U3 snoRNP protein involved in maturation of pre-18S rRNA, based on computational analysis of large-scale protein-protein interaction data [Maudiozyma barnettii]|uniref:Similar to Saccharomyces cerevisiae YJL069C UTP18 Possible U3 snoRNP protein involved in maturation of pre-18S rRNA, based on computational analysis of large-scale protein-protein interaction data n=1 Tax=Maudiozyma barnettii TaxID=61262 RepID=A0A8H2ZM87_9SACH|nr:Utp18p [Kazachstania barnettii]CAB4256852.1 similar to Saccharomyces cerevisiae YJL069C UTP18 Possible U3 snoRNP protein involved in maturation of pre-18S rRNA, based on computational analysis of large-scale protein-protein interaction data [Kazachstania barnettii]CAD1785271.1 similar to Saccharomyces cerevisiae YJL069C UTP18 Possible U3 snoRNP protein involved in maturation of pre-18S rRNA, based on computational analysis of large-scale protein-protein interaction data [Kazachstania barnettii